MSTFNVQKITTGNKTAVTFGFNNYRSMTFTNTHATAAITIDLYVTSQVGTDITDTGTNVNQSVAPTGYAVTTSSQAIVVDGTAATSDIFLDEQVWKSDCELFGTCTVFTDGTHITFGGGIIKAMADDISLYTGTRYHVLNNVKIPNGVSLKLTSDEFNFDNNRYNMYIDSDDAAGYIDIITRY